jgi:hypothetical protein
MLYPPLGYGAWISHFGHHSAASIRDCARRIGRHSMTAAAIKNVLRRSGASLPVLLVPVLLLWAVPVAAQPGFPPSAAPAARNQTCIRLESQLAAIDRGVVDPAKAEQIKRHEDAAAKQQAELDRLGQQSSRLGCQGGGFFALFSGQTPQCGPLNNQIQQVRSNLDRFLTEIQRLQGNSGEREGQRRGVLVALGQNDCGPQYRRYATSGPGAFFENLFGGSPGGTMSDVPMSGTYRTLCVRTCDGYYFPISYSTVPSRFADDEQVCRRMCPATETALYTHRNPGEDVARSVSSGGRLYTELPTAFNYRKQLDVACACRLPGQSWAEALRQSDDQTLERGDIVVTEERAKQLSLPRLDAQGKPVNLDPAPGRPAPKSTTGSTPRPAAVAPVAPPVAAEEKIEEDPSKRKVRAVGPTFLPAR